MIILETLEKSRNIFLQLNQNLIILKFCWTFSFLNLYFKSHLGIHFYCFLFKFKNSPCIISSEIEKLKIYYKVSVLRPQINFCKFVHWGCFMFITSDEIWQFWVNFWICQEIRVYYTYLYFLLLLKNVEKFIEQSQKGVTVFKSSKCFVCSLLSKFRRFENSTNFGETFFYQLGKLKLKNLKILQSFYVF